MAEARSYNGLQRMERKKCPKTCGGTQKSGSEPQMSDTELFSPVDFNFSNLL